MMTGIYESGFFPQKMAVLWRITLFQKKVAETPVFIVFFVCTLWAKVSKREILKHTPKKEKIDW